MTNLIDRVREIVADALDRPVAEVTLDKPLEDLGADSLDSIELVQALEAHFHIGITNEEAAHINTVGDLYALVDDHYEGAQS